MRINFIEPLLEKLRSLIKAGQRDCLKKSLALYGVEEDINTLVRLIEKKYDRNAVLIVDLTPFTSLGTQTRLNRLSQAYGTTPFVALVKKGIVLEHLRTLGKISTVVTDEDFRVVGYSFVGNRKSILKNKCLPFFGKGQDAFNAHTKWVEDRLFQLVPHCIRKPESGCRYIQLADETWADVWIDVKSILSDPDTSFFISYQLGYQLSKAYSQIPEEDVLVAGNNNAYILASFLHLIFDDKQLVMLDRLGPYPSISRTRILEAQRLDKKRCCVIEDVLGTGRETDLITLLTFLSQGRVERVACLYNLQIASPLLVPDEKIISLCKPSPKIKYKRQPKYKGYQSKRI